MRYRAGVAALLLVLPVAVSAQSSDEDEVEVDFDGDREIRAGVAGSGEGQTAGAEEEEVSFVEEEGVLEPPEFPSVERVIWLAGLPIALWVIVGLNVAWGGGRAGRKRREWPSPERQRRQWQRGVG